MRLSFMVVTDGSVGDLVIEDSTSGLLEDLAREAVLRWKYAPATFAGKPVEQANTGVILLFEINPPLNPSRRFVRTYREIQERLEQQDLDAAQREIAGLLRSDGLNLRERSYLYLLDAELHGQKGEPSRQRRSLERAVIREGRFLKRDAYAAALRSLFILRLEAQELRLALQTFSERSELEDPDAALTAAAERVRELIAGDDSIGRLGRIPSQSEIDAGEARRVWTHVLARRDVGFQGIDGDLDELSFRCSRRRATDEITSDKVWTIPDSWGDCTVYVYGQEGSTFTFVEYPPAE